MVVAVVVFLALIGGMKFFQIKAAMSGGGFQPPPEAVTTVIAEPEEWSTNLSAIGTVAAVNGVMVSADLSGVIDKIHFTSGQSVNRGDVLVSLDTRQERAQLASAQAQLELARLSLERVRGLLAEQVVAQSTYDEVAAGFQSAEARVDEIRAAITRKVIRAPFSGVTGIRQVNLGQYLAGGAPIVSLQSLRPVHVNFAVPQQEIGHITPGTAVEVTSDALDAPESGRVAALNSVIDEATRNVQVQAIFDNRSGRLRPGMFVDVQLSHGAPTSVIPLPASAISYAPFGDSVFIVEQVQGEDGKSYLGVRQQFVKLGGSRGDQVAVVTGVKPGEQVVTSGAFKLRPGAAVTVDNTVQPANSATPDPENS